VDGSKLGNCDGWTEENDVGIFVGYSLDGKLDGFTVGLLEGERDGLHVKEADGLFVGFNEGNGEGAVD